MNVLSNPASLNDIIALKFRSGRVTVQARKRTNNFVGRFKKHELKHCKSNQCCYIDTSRICNEVCEELCG